MADCGDGRIFFQHCEPYRGGWCCGDDPSVGAGAAAAAMDNDDVMIVDDTTPLSGLVGVVIGPGAGVLSNRRVYDELTSAGAEIHVVFNDAYDNYPIGWDRTPREDWPRGPHDKNLATLARLVCDKIKQLGKVDFIICGSRGGQVTIGEVWKDPMCRLPTICLNSGVLTTDGTIPNIPLVLACFGQDYFTSVNSFKKVSERIVQRVHNLNNVWIYFHPHMQHMPHGLDKDIVDVVITLLRLPYVTSVHHPAILQHP